MKSLNVNELVREHFPYHWATISDTELILSYVTHHMAHAVFKGLYNTKDFN